MDKKALLAQARWGRSRSKKRASKAYPPQLLKKLKENPRYAEELKQLGVKKSVTTQDDYVDLLNAADLEIDIQQEGRYMRFTWHGARLMTYNKLLEAKGYFHYYRYKKAWHHHVELAVMQAKLNGFTFMEPVYVNALRVAKKMVDEDSLDACFKFAIDGFRYAHILQEDNPEHMTMDSKQMKGDYAVSIEIYAKSLNLP